VLLTTQSPTTSCTIPHATSAIDFNQNRPRSTTWILVHITAPLVTPLTEVGWFGEVGDCFLSSREGVQLARWSDLRNSATSTTPIDKHSAILMIKQDVFIAKYPNDG
jgi:hypothetical protein